MIYTIRNKLRYLCVVQNPLHNMVAGDIFRLSFVAGDNTVAQNIGRDLLDIFGCYKATPFKEGMRSRGGDQVNTGSR